MEIKITSPTDRSIAESMLSMIDSLAFAIHLTDDEEYALVDALKRAMDPMSAGQ